MAATRKLADGITKALSRRLLAIILMILFFGLGSMGCYLLETGCKEQQRERIQMLIEAGVSLDGAVRFDDRFADKSYRTPWQRNEPYGGDEVKFAEMWVKDSVVAELLLDYYYCNSSNYNCLVWLFGSLKKGVSYWENAVTLSVYGDANGDGRSNYYSLLGPHADVLETFRPNPLTIYALNNNLSNDVITQLKPFELDGQMDEWEKKVVDLMIDHEISGDRLEWIVENLEPNPATIYALECGLPNDWIERIEPLGKDGHLAEWERYLIGHLEQLPPIYVDWAIEKGRGSHALTDWERYFANHVDRLLDSFIGQVLDDGYISYEEWMQTQFIARFSKEYLEEKGEEWTDNPDLDGDGFTNEFEIGFSFTDPYFCNERYAVLAYSGDLPAIWKDQIRAVQDFLVSDLISSDPNLWAIEGKPYGRFREENVFGLYENTTYQSFRELIGNLADRLNEDDMVFVLFAGHGEKDHITFSDGDVSYEEIGEELARVDANVLTCIVDACYSGSSIAYLGSEDRIVITSSGENEKTYGWTVSHSFFSAMQNRSNDLDGNGYCSILESFYGAKLSLEGKFGNHPLLSNEFLAERTYLMEFYVGERKS